MPTDAHGNEYGDIYVLAKRADGGYAGSLSSTSMDPGGDLHRVSSFLELERASRLRGVKFTPHAIGGVLVCAPDAPFLLLLRGWFRERRRALANREKRGIEPSKPWPRV
jgi:hypothetical protein